MKNPVMTGIHDSDETTDNAASSTHQLMRVQSYRPGVDRTGTLPVGTIADHRDLWMVTPWLPVLVWVVYCGPPV